MRLFCPTTKFGALSCPRPTLDKCRIASRFFPLSVQYFGGSGFAASLTDFDMGFPMHVREPLPGGSSARFWHVSFSGAAAHRRALSTVA